MQKIFALLTLLCLSFASGCAALADDMDRAENSFELAQYEHTIVWLDDLAPQTPAMEREMLTRYFYLRGMAAFRLGNRPDALHFLALAREVAGDRNQGLRAEWSVNLRRTLAELLPGETSGAEEEEMPSAPVDDERPGTRTRSFE